MERGGLEGLEGLKEGLEREEIEGMEEGWKDTRGSQGGREGLGSWVVSWACEVGGWFSCFIREILRFFVQSVFIAVD